MATNPWVDHCKAYATKHKCSYKDAMKYGKGTYTPKKKPPKTYKGKGVLTVNNKRHLGLYGGKWDNSVWWRFFLSPAIDFIGSIISVYFLGINIAPFVKNAVLWIVGDATNDLELKKKAGRDAFVKEVGALFTAGVEASGIIVPMWSKPFTPTIAETVAGKAWDDWKANGDIEAPIADYLKQILSGLPTYLSQLPINYGSAFTDNVWIPTDDWANLYELQLNSGTHTYTCPGMNGTDKNKKFSVHANYKPSQTGNEYELFMKKFYSFDLGRDVMYIMNRGGKWYLAGLMDGNRRMIFYSPDQAQMIDDSGYNQPSTTLPKSGSGRRIKRR
jgi:hypothetical protein